MDTQEKLFTSWVNVKYDAQSLAGIIQNEGVEYLSEEEIAYWNIKVEKLKKKIEVLALATNQFIIQRKKKMRKDQ